MLISAGQQRGVSGGLLLLSKVQERGQLAQPCRVNDSGCMGGHAVKKSEHENEEMVVLVE